MSNHPPDINKMISETPRTNHMLIAILETHGHVGFLNCPPAWVALARELERELNAANERIKLLELAGHHLYCWLDRNTPIGVRNDWLKAKEATP